MNAAPTILAVDTETTSLRRPYLRSGRRVWDIAIIRRDPDGTENRLQAFTRLSDLGLIEQLPLNVALSGAGHIKDKLQEHLPADVLKSLTVGRFWERHPEMTGAPGEAYPNLVHEHHLAELLMSGWLSPGFPGERSILVGNVPNFDDLGLFDLLHRQGWIDSEAPWHYHLADMESAASGRLRRPPPWNSRELSLALGVDPDAYDRHTALGDAQWALDLYDAVYRDEEPPGPQHPEESKKAAETPPEGLPALPEGANAG